MKNSPSPILGTAMWGWTVPKEECFKLLDTYYERGFRQIDTATNYPINKNSADFRKAEKILQEWILSHGISDLEVLVKVGSVNNFGGPENDLTKSFLLLTMDEYEFIFHENLHTFSIHWDNRDDEKSIKDTFEGLQIAAEKGLKTGLSGVKHPDLYHKVNKDFNLDFRVQIKHNLLYSDYERYEPLHKESKFLAYGINAGGMKLDIAEYNDNSSLKARGGDTQTPHPITGKIVKIIKEANSHKENPPIVDFNQCGLCFAWHQERIDGILIGTSRLEQLIKSLNFMENLANYDYSSLYLDLKKLSQNKG
jgi:aryl-alcohol dehydrogenase-like predicted oxidoreductase